LTDDGFSIDVKQLSKKEYKDKINYEAILAAQINRMAMYRDTNLKQYASSVESFALMCPPNITGEAFKKMESLELHRGDYDSMNNEKLIKYDDLWIKINDLLKQEGLIFKQSSYEIGIEE
jgi:hypothetical protein